MATTVSQVMVMCETRTATVPLILTADRHICETTAATLSLTPTADRHV